MPFRAFFKLVPIALLTSIHQLADNYVDAYQTSLETPVPASSLLLNILLLSCGTLVRLIKLKLELWNSFCLVVFHKSLELSWFQTCVRTPNRFFCYAAFQTFLLRFDTVKIAAKCIATRSHDGASMCLKPVGELERMPCQDAAQRKARAFTKRTNKNRLTWTHPKFS